ncbi:hypothetical protein [Vibrio alfacsensis]|uniref:hypothetical protein n=1 Tax=Vibrio TaxID=662 RepID=UPI004068892D
MKLFKLKTISLLSAAMALAGCGDEAPGSAVNPDAGNPIPPTTELVPQPTPNTFPQAKNGDALLGNPEYQAVSYGAWRSTVREDGINVPSIAEQKEDMKILSSLGIKMLRTYNTQGFTGLDGRTEAQNLLDAITQLKAEDPEFEMYVMLGIWIDAKGSWTDTVIHDENNPANYDEVAAAKELALQYPDIIKVIAVGNEAMVNWAPYHVTPDIILEHVSDLQTWKKADPKTSDLWVTTSENYAVWAGEDNNGNNDNQTALKALINAVDYVSLHTYAHHDTKHNPSFAKEWQVPLEDQYLPKEDIIENAMDKVHQYTLAQIQAAQAFINRVNASKPIHIGETGWSTVSTDGFGLGGTQAADEYKQKLFHDNMRTFTDDFGASLFFFQAFDEPWKGDPANSYHSEKHFGLIDIDCNVKYVEWDKVEKLNSLGLDRGCPNGTFNASYSGDLPSLLDDALTPPYEVDIAPSPEGTFVVLGETLFDGAMAYGWDNPITAWAGVNDDTGILTVVASPDMAASWGWGAGVANPDQNLNLSDYNKVTFKVRGVSNADSTLAKFGFYVGFQTVSGGNHWIEFNTGDYTLTESWQTITVDINDFSGNKQLSQVNSPFTVASIDGMFNASQLTHSELEFKDISWVK